MSTTLTVAPASFELGQIYNDETFRDAAGGLWVTGRTGNRWTLALTWNNRSGDDRRAIWSFIASGRGAQNNLTVPLSVLNYSRAGAGGGTPLLNGAATAGAVSLSIKNGPVSQTDWLKAGDFIDVENALKIVTDDVDTDGSGLATVSIWPELRANQADNTAVEIDAPNFLGFQIDVQGMGAAAMLFDQSAWLNPSVTLVLEEDATL